MKYLISVLLIIISFGIKAQSFTPESHRQFPFIKVDSAAIYTPGDTVGRGSVAGAIKFKSSDHSFYFHNGTSWHPFVTDSLGMISRLNDKVDSVTLASNILYYWKVGVGYGVTLPIGTDSAFTRISAPNDSTLIFYRFNHDSVSISLRTATGGGGSGSMIYPGAGIAKSTGSAWTTSITDNSSNWNTVLNRVLYTDTASMLSNYRHWLAGYTKNSDTSAMLAAYRSWLNTKVNISDTAAMLSPYINATDTLGRWVNFRDSIIRYVTPTQLIPYLKTDGWYNIVRDGGADTTGINDISNIIQSAINAGRKNILIPHGNFKISSTVQLKDSVTISGLGTSSIISLSSNIPAFKISLGNGGNLSTISDLMIKGNYSSGATIAQEGIRLDSAYGFSGINITMHDINVGFHFMKNGYCCGTYTVTGMRGNTVINPFIDSSNIAIVCDSAAEYIKVIGGSLVNNQLGYNNWRSGNIVFEAVNISSNQLGIKAIGGANDGHSSFNGCVINHNISALYIDSISKGLYFNGCMLYNQYDSSRIKNSDRITWTGGYFTPTRVLWQNNTNSSFVNVSDLNGVTNSWNIIGTPPTIFGLNDAQRINKALSYSYNINGSLTGNNLITKSLADSLLNFKVDSIYRTPGKDSVQFTIGGRYYAIKDSTGGGGSMIYPGAGIAVSTGSAWTTSITDNHTNWDNAYTDRLKWDGGATGLTAATGRTSLGATTVGSNLFTLTNPSAVTFLRINADNTVSTRTAAQMLTDIGATSGTVTSVATNNGSGITGGTITGSGTLALDTALIVQTKADVQRKLDSTANSNSVTFRKPTTDFSLFKYIGTPVYTWKALRAGYGIIHDSTSAGDTIIITKVDTINVATRDRAKQIADSVRLSIATPTFQQVLTAGSTLTTGNQIDLGAAHYLVTQSYVAGKKHVYSYMQDSLMKFIVRDGTSTDLLSMNMNGTDTSLKITGFKNNIGQDRLLGQISSSGRVGYITLGSGLSLSAGVLSASGGSGSPGGTNTQVQYNNSGAFAGISGATTDGTTMTLTTPAINNIKGNYTSTVSSSGTLTLVNSSNYTQNISGTSPHTIVTPDATTMTAGMGYYITNNSTGVLTVNKNGGTLLQTVAAGQTLALTVSDISSAAGIWNTEYSGNIMTFKKVLAVNTLKIF